MDIFKLIDNAKFVSFDIFDTVVKRNVRIPTDVFDLVEEEYNELYSCNLSSFKKNRRASEKNARRKSINEEVTLKEIYKELLNYYNSDQIDKLRDIEIKFEKILCRNNSEFNKIYSYAKEKGKKIIITSDMYLDRSVIEEILYNSNITDYEKLYLSSEIGLTKHKGSIYNYILKDLKCNPNEILHIGDNDISDFKQAKANGINTYKIDNNIHSNRVNKYNNLSVTDINRLNIINSFINHNLNGKDEKNEFYDIGYRKLGILFYGYLQWIHNSSIENGLDKLLFFSRDGFVLKEAYEQSFDKEKKIEVDYMYVSRRALIVPSLKDDITFERLIDILGLRKKDTIKSFFSRIGLDYKRYMKEISICDYSLEGNLELLSKKTDFEKLFNLIKEDLIANSQKEKEVLIKYLNQLDIIDKKIGVIDIGWRGSMQYSLMNVLSDINSTVEVQGFYVGMNRDAKKFIDKGMNANGYLFSYDRNVEYEFISSGFVGLLETFFLAPHGSVIGYKENNNGIVEPILDELEYTEDDLELTKAIQRGAIDFVKEFYAYNKELGIMVNEKVAFNNLINLGLTPNKKDLKIFSELSFSDFDKCHLAKPDSYLKYIVNPKKLNKDFFESQWKVGFLAGLFKLPLPYFKIYKTMKKMHEGKNNG